MEYALKSFIIYTEGFSSFNMGFSLLKFDERLCHIVAAPDPFILLLTGANAALDYDFVS